jgi:predicted transcriptional regulator of viral defense system
MNRCVRGRLTALASDQLGIFTRQQALESGYSSDEIQRILSRGEWRRIRQGVYVERSVWEALPARDQSLLEIRAAYTRVRARGVISHWSAALVWGLDLHEPDLSLLHLTRPDRHSSRKEAGVHHHVGRLDASDAVEIDGLPVTSLARTVIDLACLAIVESGLVAADCALRRGLTRAQLEEQLHRQADNPGAIKAGHVVSRADGRAESPGETLCRYVFEQLDLPAPELQVEFHDSSGFVRARTDFAWPERRLIAEFDGKSKYCRDLAEGESAGDVVWREKLREDWLRRTHRVGVERIIWVDLYPSRRRRLNLTMREALGL